MASQVKGSLTAIALSATMKFLEIPEEVANVAEPRHLKNLYRVCRLCYTRTSATGGNTTPPPGEKNCGRAATFYGIDLKREVTNLALPKVLCAGCTRRLARFEKDPDSFESWKESGRFYVDALQLDSDVVVTRTDPCSTEVPCRVCVIVANRKPNFLQAQHSNAPKKGRPLEQSPPKAMCSKCGQPIADHDDAFCAMVMKNPCRAKEAGRKFARRTEARGFTEQLVQEHLRDSFTSGTGGSESSKTPMRTGVKLDGHRYLGITPARYDGKAGTGTCLSTEAARDLLRLGHLGLGKDSARELCTILGREGIRYPIIMTISGGSIWWEGFLPNLPGKLGPARASFSLCGFVVLLVRMGLGPSSGALLRRFVSHD
ncbi:hypothetical protein FOZ62_028902 [Perkinsus olseni]|uniref:Uncharacterized protein n=2 Tax=Perkinsus olseni TaxID=32597 RepID=A0A7J6QEM7_PEROL|nr:hypothetical protein FOZ62_028902 [Perkinsus olseni]